MKKLFSILLSLIIILVFANFAFAASSSGGALLYDEADLLSSLEEKEVLSALNEVSDKYNVDIVVAAVETAGADFASDYAEDFYDENNYGRGTTRDGALLILIMDERDYRILSNGMVADAISLDDIDRIGDEIVSDLSAGAYANAFIRFAEECDYYINGHLNGFPFPFGFIFAICFGVAFVIALIVVIVMRLQLKSVRKQHNAGYYTNRASINITRTSDLFLYRNVVTVRKPEPSSSSRSGGRSSGSRNVGGGKF